MTTLLVAIASFYGGALFALVLIALLSAAAKGDRREAERDASDEMRVYRKATRSRLPVVRRGPAAWESSRASSLRRSGVLNRAAVRPATGAAVHRRVA